MPFACNASSLVNEHAIVPDMRIVLASGTLLLLALTAALTVEVPRQSQAPATGTVSSQQQPKRSNNTVAGRGARKIPCKTPENASQCYWTHGRLWYESWHFTWLLWKIGTHRLLKICDEPIFLNM